MSGKKRLETLVIAAVGIDAVLVFEALDVHMFTVQNEAAEVLGPLFKALFRAQTGVGFPKHLTAEHGRVGMVKL
jgi:hypothetical protein